MEFRLGIQTELYWAEPKGPQLVVQLVQRSAVKTDTSLVAQKAPQWAVKMVWRWVAQTVSNSAQMSALSMAVQMVQNLVATTALRLVGQKGRYLVAGKGLSWAAQTGNS